MNKLVLIGNGFDLAHGLKTKYNDFLLWYLSKSITSLNYGTIYEDNLIKLSPQIQRTHFSLNELSELDGRLKGDSIKLEYNSDFFKIILSEYADYKWVDIERIYYISLVQLYKRLEKRDLERHKVITSELNKLNSDFNFLKEQLVKYLNQIDMVKEKDNNIINHFYNTLQVHNQTANQKDILFLNFNYTNTIEMYKELFPFDTSFNLINIHGKLGAHDNPIIFGYGDEIDSFYEKIERLNENEFLKNMKSFGYFKTNNYLKFQNELEGDKFDVYIMGHSCGLSDRILLNSIFTHKNCQRIFVFYYQKTKDENDYFEKTQEISRHFPPSAKSKMRKKIVSFLDCKPLTPFVPNNETNDFD